MAQGSGLRPALTAHAATLAVDHARVDDFARWLSLCLRLTRARNDNSTSHLWEFPDHGGLGEPAGMLAPAAYMGERPPLLSDYANDEVSVAVQQPASQTMIVMSSGRMPSSSGSWLAEISRNETSC
jgi:hypothetical protein